MSVAEARLLAVRRLRAAGVDSAEAEAMTLLEAVTGLDRGELLLVPDRRLSEEERLRLLELLRRRAAREPLQHILGRAPFYGLELEVDASVLVPRPETERLVELVLEKLRGREAPSVLDIGTGTGAIALAVKAERPDASVMAADVSPAAVTLARRNAERLRLAVRVRRSDLLAEAEVAAFAAGCDALVANLPYLPAGDAAGLQPEARRDPPGALFAGEDGLRYARRLLDQAYRLLPGGALLALELDPRNVRLAAAAARAWRSAGVEVDLAGRERFLTAVR
ncbi:MAG TPA: peptide chain release factor N(5)-glutamine methyltransferase [Trueperaceae bacterium]|nr:peptide chain release factor N(5)-glutamine methyltransferase [Trueperaceae bacterium]